MKPTLNKEIEMSSKGIDYVDSLVPTDQDCINAAKYQLDDLYIRAGETGIYTKDEKGKCFLLRKEILPLKLTKKNKPNYLAIIVFAFGALATGLWTLWIFNLIKNAL